MSMSAQQERELRQLQEQMVNMAKSSIQMVDNFITTGIFSENGLSSDQKKEAHSIMVDLKKNASPENIAKATELMKQFTGK